MSDSLLYMTRHAEQRSLDRSIPNIARHLLLNFGSCKPAGKSEVRYSFDKQSWRDVEREFGTWPLKKMEQLRRVYMVVGDDGSVITLAYRD